jgi:CheY-like chemotaxis protein
MGARILIVEDDQDIVEAMRLPLEANGYEVVHAASGKEALERVKGVMPALIILDVMMESDTEGFQVAYQLRNTDPRSEYANCSGIPILMITAIGSEKRMSFSPETDRDFLPVDRFLEKPVQPGELLRNVSELIQKR